MQIAIALFILLCCGGFLWWFRHDQNKSKLNANEEEERALEARATAQEFVNARDVGESCLYTSDDNIMAAIKLEGLSIELYSFAEQEIIKNNLSARLSSIRYPYKYIAVSRPADISLALREYGDFYSEAIGGRKKLLKFDMDSLVDMVVSGETLERQYYIVIWNSIKREDERTITARADELARIFTENRVKGTVQDKRGLVRMCNLVNIPAYAHIESMDIEDNLTVLKQR